MPANNGICATTLTNWLEVRVFVNYDRLLTNLTFSSPDANNLTDYIMEAECVCKNPSTYLFEETFLKD